MFFLFRKKKAAANGCGGNPVDETTGSGVICRNIHLSVAIATVNYILSNFSSLRNGMYKTTHRIALIAQMTVCFGVRTT